VLCISPSKKAKTVELLLLPVPEISIEGCQDSRKKKHEFLSHAYLKIAEFKLGGPLIAYLICALVFLDLTSGTSDCPFKF
jgi:hypothetical protein